MSGSRGVGIVVLRSGAAGVYWGAFAASWLGCSTVIWAGAASAQSYRQHGQQARHQHARPAQAQPRIEPREPEGPLLALVSIGSQRLRVYDRNGLLATSGVSSGKRGHESPQGIFSIIEKKEEHFSNLYEDAEMPWMQRLTWSGVAFHAGALPGYPASKGCIRLPHGFAQSWFDMTRVNTRVIITPNDTAPAPIAHERLFQPRLARLDPAPAASPSPAPQAPAAEGEQQPASATRPAPAFSSEDGGTEGPMMLGGRKLPRPDPAAAATEPAVPQKAVVSAMEAAQARKLAASQGAAAAAKAAEQARVAVKARQTKAQAAERAAKQAEALQAQADGRLAVVEKALAAAKTDEARKQVEAQKAKLVEDVAKLTRTATDARAAATERANEVKEAQASIKTLDQARAAAQAEARDAARLTEPVSVFVSLETRRVYVRQSREAVMEAEVEIKDPSAPIGTHVFTAMQADASGRVRWSVVNVASAVAWSLPSAERERTHTRPPHVPGTVEQAAAALDRIVFPQSILDRVLPYVHVGSSLIVSDLGPSFETGKGTDFIVQTKGEEEAKESVRRIVEEKMVEKANERRDREGWPETGGRRGEQRFSEGPGRFYGPGDGRPRGSNGYGRNSSGRNGSGRNGWGGSAGYGGYGGGYGGSRGGRSSWWD